MTLADLPAYRAALDPNQPRNPADLVRFRDLWDRPDAFRGHRVKVVGRVVSVFHKGTVGQFPPLAEIWIFTDASDPFCLVCPEIPGKLVPKRGAVVEFEGTFLRKVRYQSHDVDRLAPLIVGPEAPQIQRPTVEPSPQESSIDGLFLVVIGGIIVLTIARVMLRRPRPKAIVEDPPPLFENSGSSTLDP